MRSDRYKEYFKVPNLMGPNSVRLLDELMEAAPEAIKNKAQVLDLGCGSGLTSLFIARETGATVYCADLWIKEEANRQRFEAWDMAEKLIPVHADARDLPFDKEMFDAVISIDSYHYYGTEDSFFAEHILPFLKPGGTALIAVPGMKREYHGKSEELLGSWLGDEAYMFQSAKFWEKNLQAGDDIAMVKTWELEGFDLPWQEWFATGHEYALGDQKVYESLIKPYTTFVGMMIRKK